MIVWGINALNHDASISLFSNNRFVDHKRSSDFSKIKGDPDLNQDIINHMLTAGKPDLICWYERPWLKKTRQLYAGQYDLAFNIGDLPSNYLKKFGITAPIKYTDHHLSHAAAGFLTRPHITNDATIVVLDAIGEWESATIWYGKGKELKKLWSRKYPTSLGLFYSAFTQLVGLTPTMDEHIFQQWSTRGNPAKYGKEINTYWGDDWHMVKNVHRGINDWPYPIETEQDKYDIAAAVQAVFETKVLDVMYIAKQLSPSNNLIYMGGCAMNTKANQLLPSLWKGMWSIPMPGDAGSSLGAGLYQQNLYWKWTANLAKHMHITYN